MSRLTQSQQGIGLIEVMVTLVVISIGILALVNFQSFAFRSAAVASQRAEAITLAQDKMAMLRAFSCIKTTCPSLKNNNQPTKHAFQSINGKHNDPGNNAPPKNASGYPQYDLDIKVKNYCYQDTNTSASSPCNAGVPDLKRVKITVSWADNRKFVLRSFIASIDPSSASQLYN